MTKSQDCRVMLIPSQNLSPVNIAVQLSNYIHHNSALKIKMIVGLSIYRIYEGHRQYL